MDSYADFAPGIAEQLGVDINPVPYVGPDVESTMMTAGRALVHMEFF